MINLAGAQSQDVIEFLQPIPGCKNRYYCPNCHKQSLSTKYVPYCFAGCDRDRILQAVVCGPVQSIMPPVVSDERTAEQKQRQIERIWREASPMEVGDPAHSYLTQGRKLPVVLPVHSLRYHPSLWYQGERLPAMVAAIKSVHNTLLSVHRTFLRRTPNGSYEKVAKMLMPSPVNGCTNGGAIRLCPIEDTLGVAEGIETALACHFHTGIPVWATRCADSMKQLVLPSCLQHLIVFADNDRNNIGQNAARTLKQRATAMGIGVKVLIPDEPGTDWDDQIKADRQAAEATIHE